MPRRAAALLLALAVLPIAGCGGDDPEQEVRAALEQLERSIRARDFEAVCDDLLADELLDQLRAAGVACDVALGTGLGRVRDATVEVGDVTVDGDKATARVTTGARGQSDSTDRVRLVREDDRWKIASLAG